MKEEEGKRGGKRQIKSLRATVDRDRKDWRVNRRVMEPGEERVQVG